jgi:multiple sugar transport system permease protein
VMIGIQYFQQLAPAWGETMAYSTMITIPVLIVFLAFQRNFVKSIASTGVKG